MRKWNFKEVLVPIRKDGYKRTISELSSLIHDLKVYINGWHFIHHYGKDFIELRISADWRKNKKKICDMLNIYGLKDIGSWKLKSYGGKKDNVPYYYKALEDISELCMEYYLNNGKEPCTLMFQIKHWYSHIFGFDERENIRQSALLIYNGFNSTGTD
jgi:hypothetical protein